MDGGSTKEGFDQEDQGQDEDEEEERFGGWRDNFEDLVDQDLTFEELREKAIEAVELPEFKDASELTDEELDNEEFVGLELNFDDIDASIEDDFGMDDEDLEDDPEMDAMLSEPGEGSTKKRGSGEPDPDTGVPEEAGGEDAEDQDEGNNQDDGGDGDSPPKGPKDLKPGDQPGSSELLSNKTDGDQDTAEAKEKEEIAPPTPEELEAQRLAAEQAELKKVAKAESKEKIKQRERAIRKSQNAEQNRRLRKTGHVTRTRAGYLFKGVTPA